MFPLKIDEKLLDIGNNCSIDPTVSIGEIPQRKVDSLYLKIGKNSTIRSHSVIYAGSKLGNSFNSGHSVIIREENEIGDNVMVWSNSIVDYGCKIGNRVKIHSLVYIAQFTIIEEDAFLAPGVITGNDLHPGCEKSKACLKGPIIKKRAQIGLNCTILPYVTIGEYAVIGAGSVVTRDIPNKKLAYGIPARVICDVNEIECIHKPPWVKKPYPFK